MGWGVGRTDKQAKKDQKKRDEVNRELRAQAARKKARELEWVKKRKEQVIGW